MAKGKTGAVDRREDREKKPGHGQNRAPEGKPARYF